MDRHRSLALRIDSPETMDDHIEAAQAWARGDRSHWNAIMSACGPELAPALTALADAAQVQAHAAAAQALALRSQA